MTKSIDGSLEIVMFLYISVVITTTVTYVQVSGYASTIVHAGAWLAVATTDGDITIGASGAGVYHVDASISLTRGNAAMWHCASWMDEAEQNGAEFERKMGPSNDVGSASLTGMFTLAAAEVVSIRCKNQSDTDNMTVNHISFNIHRVSP